MIYIFDIDGTIANLEHRLHFIQQKPSDWPAFFAACGDDEPIHDMFSLARIIADKNETVLVSGRSDECREQTMAWIGKHKFPAPGRKIFMRKAGDHREDWVVKSELLDQLIVEWGVPKHFQIAGIFEDRQQVVDMYRARGLRVFQVAEGKF